MGLLLNGKPLSWSETRKKREHVHTRATMHILDIYEKYKDRVDDSLLWGDEMEYQVIHMDRNNHRARLSLCSHDTLMKLMDSYPTQWHPEYARWMLEATPKEPYTYDLQSLAWDCEQSMRSRRQMAMSLLAPNEKIFSLTSFPSLGSTDCLWNGKNPIPKETPYSHSKFLPDFSISEHPRFAALTSNIRKRRGSSSVKIALPVFRDFNTKWPFYDSTMNRADEVTSAIDPVQSSSYSNNEQFGYNIQDHHQSFCDKYSRLNHQTRYTDLLNDNKNHDHMNQTQIINSKFEPFPLKGQTEKNTDEGLVLLDAMGFGMGLCCLQTTIQCLSLESACRLYDCLAVLAPIMLSLTASTPALKSLLLDVDSRWDIISAAVDDRSPEELESNPILKKSRYASISTFISTSNPILNDIPLPVNVRLYDTLVRAKNAPMDIALARHFGYLFVRDPLVLYDDKCASEGKVAEVIPESDKSKSVSVYDIGNIDSARKVNASASRTNILQRNTENIDFALLAYTNPSTFSNNISMELKEDENLQAVFPSITERLSPDEVLFSSFVQNNNAETECTPDESLFECIQSTNWNTVRLKLPSKLLSILTWRVEFRPMEAQVPDFESAAFVAFIQLIGRGIVSGNSKIHLIPISKLDMNMANSQKRDAVRLECFHWRHCHDDHEIQMKTVNEIINDPEVGLISMARLQLRLLEKKAILTYPDNEVKAQVDVIERYLSFISGRASGRIPTPARFMREFITRHPSYAHDSFIPDNVVYDLVEKISLYSELNIPILDI